MDTGISGHRIGLPPRQGLYDPQFEHDACGMGFVADLKGRRSHEIVRQALQVLANLAHRGAVGAEANTGDGAGSSKPSRRQDRWKKAWGIWIRMPAPSPVFASSPTAPRWARLASTWRACRTISWDLLPFRSATKPMPQASCSNWGS